MSNGFVSAGHPAHAAILARPAPRIVDTWLIARVAVWATYPCVCTLGQPCNTRNHAKPLCRCWGRTDGLDQMPPHCCAARAARVTARRDRDGMPWCGGNPPTPKGATK